MDGFVPLHPRTAGHACPVCLPRVPLVVAARTVRVAGWGA